ncbi:MAG: hypothetical protein K9J12_06050 [Melioribacteraceae bacterium]|nr:hypothetical protein [Melioribacteraceae bacterium]MCF8414020.1 hypothetical protein [Melioribacteraceae bacterium]MCF8432004.1 hypothetical protein [Melioribacteraceae bacterium]
MDNIVDILFLLFFIVSFLLSIFKKKKAPKDAPKETNSNYRYEDSSADTYQKDDSFFEVPDLFGEDSEEPVRNPVPQSYRPESQIPQKQTQQEVVYTDPNEVLDKIRYRPSDQPKLSQRLNIKMSSPSSQRKVNKRAKRIRKMFKEHDNLQDYIIFSEILNKPKALRR